MGRRASTLCGPLRLPWCKARDGCGLWREESKELDNRDAPASLETPGARPGRCERLGWLIDPTDQQIDALVYELYGLTAAEIAIVEGGQEKHGLAE